MLRIIQFPKDFPKRGDVLCVTYFKQQTGNSPSTITDAIEVAVQARGISNIYYSGTTIKACHDSGETEYIIYLSNGAELHGRIAETIIIWNFNGKPAIISRL